jgi:hypothetical protein
MARHQDSALVNQRSTALGDDAARYSEVVRLGEIDERPDVREQIERVDNPNGRGVRLTHRFGFVLRASVDRGEEQG